MKKMRCIIRLLLLLLLLVLFVGCNNNERESHINNTIKTPPESDEPIFMEEPQIEIPDGSEVSQGPEVQYISFMEELSTKLNSPYGSKYDVEYRMAELKDFDGDNVRELMLTYLTHDKREQFLEIWTINGEVLTQIKKQILYNSAGGPLGGVCHISKDEVDYLCIYEFNVDGTIGIDDNRMFRYLGVLQFFSIQENLDENTSASDMLKEEHVLSYAFSGPDERTPSDINEPPEFLFDGEKSDVLTYNEWMSAFDQSSETYLSVGRGTYVGHSFEDIIAELKK